MTPQEATELFVMFVQFSPNELQRGGGSGIGLYLSQKIISGHNSKIQVYTEKGKGSIFYFDFPLVAQKIFLHVDVHDDVEANHSRLRHEEAVKPFCTEESSCHCGGETQSVGAQQAELNTSMLTVKNCTLSSCSEGPSAVPSKRRWDLSILIVDDSPLNRRMLKRIIQQEAVGVEILEASDGLELLQMVGVSESENTHQHHGLGAAAQVYATPKSFDVIILDNHMPRMGGKPAVQRLRRAGYSGIVIGLTGDASATDLEDFCKAGADFALAKPLDVEKLFTLISAHQRASERLNT
jgi:CheY-like chemotaxis protein